MLTIKCLVCGNNFVVHRCRATTAKTCSASCRGSYVGVLRRKNAKPILRTMGYWYIKKPEHHRADCQGYVKVADLILEAKLARKLLKNEIAHHIDGNKLNDNPKNLEPMDNVEHTRMHHELRRKPENTVKCVWCGITFKRPGKKRPKKYCSRKCMALSFSKQFRQDLTRQVQL